MLSVRCISDPVEDDLPVPADVLLDARTGRPDSLAFFRYLIGHRFECSGFNQLLKNARVAQIELAKGLKKFWVSSSEAGENGRGRPLGADVKIWAGGSPGVGRCFGPRNSTKEPAVTG